MVFQKQPTCKMKKRNGIKTLFKNLEPINGIMCNKGHFIAHGIGGPMDVNMFIQRHNDNRGADKHSVPKNGKLYVETPGTFLFSRPIYQDYPFVPKYLEFGYFTKEREIMCVFQLICFL
jgi:hypothetical protein